LMGSHREDPHFSNAGLGRLAALVQVSRHPLCMFCVRQEPPTFSDVEEEVLAMDPSAPAAGGAALGAWYDGFRGRLALVSRLEQVGRVCAHGGLAFPLHQLESAPRPLRRPVGRRLWLVARLCLS
jgi:hypothetical protein